MEKFSIPKEEKLSQVENTRLVGNELIENGESAPEGWMTNNLLSTKLDRSFNFISKTADSFRSAHPEYFREYYGVGGTNEYYSPELAQLIITKIEEIPDAPEGWVTNGLLRKKLDRSDKFMRKIAESFRSTHPEYFNEYRSAGGTSEHYSPELVQLITAKVEEVSDAPEGWLTNGLLSTKLDRSFDYISKIADSFRPTHSKDFKEYRSAGGTSEHYSPELVQLITAKVEEIQDPPEGWVTNGLLRKKLDRTDKSISKVADSFRSTHPEYFKIYRGVGPGGMNEYYSPELVQLITAKVEEVSDPPEGWVTNGLLRKKLDRSFDGISKVADSFRSTHPEYFKIYRGVGPGGMNEYYSPELVQLITAKVEEVPDAPEGWVTNNLLSIKLDRSNGYISKVADSYRSTHSKDFKEYRGANGTSEHYSPELVQLITAKVEEVSDAPEGWVTNNLLSIKLDRSNAFISKVADSFRPTRPEYFKEYRTNGYVSECYSPELAQLITAKVDEFSDAPEGWVTNSFLRKKLGKTDYMISKIAESYRSTHPEYFREYHGVGPGGVNECYSPELTQLITEKIEKLRSLEDLDKEKIENNKKLIKNYESLIELIPEGETLEAQEFRKLLSIFGSNNVLDILYKYRPEFSNLSQEFIRGSLAKYLGDFLIVRSNFNIEDVFVGLPYLSETKFQDALFEVMKEDCLKNYHLNTLGVEDFDNRSIISGYIKSIREKSDSFNNADLEVVIDRVENFYGSILNDFKKPEVIVDSLKGGRLFPDLNQVLNIKEIKDKKRMLISDEMGMGKSASAILAKEYLGLKQAVVVVPSNVINTWQRYFSDTISETGEQIGYFKKGMAPRVLVVEDKGDLENVNMLDFDYILISQERMREDYVGQLKKIDYDMLIVDEVHKVKNIQEGERSKNVLELAQNIEGKNEYLVLLSGTPVPNKVKDIAMVLKLLYPDQLQDIRDIDLVSKIINGDLVDLRNMLVPRMQMKSLRESIQMPELTEHIVPVELSDIEKGLYEVLLEDDELTASEKIRTFRKFVMNPASLDITPEITSSKIENVSQELNKIFETKNKIIMFVNSYVEGMIRGGNTILEKLHLPPEVIVNVIEGNVDGEQRQEIQDELKNSEDKILLVVSGQTADVGVDFSAADHVLFYNDPWTKYDKQQQIARVYRPGLKNDLTVTTSVTEGTIEEGISEYTELKYDAIQKLLKGIPITDIEKDILKRSEKQETPDIEGSVELAKEWLNSPQNRLHKFFGVTKEVGEESFHKFLLEYGEEYAECYLDMGSRGFQANTGRVAGTLLDLFIRERKQDPQKLQILDIASGPDMLKRHIDEKYKWPIISLDINEAHFEHEGEGRVVGSFLDLPFKNGTMDYTNLSLALHYTKFIPRKEEFERLKVISEMNRVLKIGGRGVINLLYSLQFKNQEKFKKVVEVAGFKIVTEYTGDIISEEYYKSPCIVLEKDRDIALDFMEFVQQVGEENFDGIKFIENESQNTRNGKKVIREFNINDKKIPIVFNKDDRAIFDEEQSILNEGEQLKLEYKSVKDIPREEIIRRGFLRIYNGKSYRLLKKSNKIGGFVDIR